MTETSKKQEQPLNFWAKYKTIILSVSITLFLVFILFAGLAFGLLKYYVDGASIKRRAIDAPLRSVLWERPLILQGKLNEVRNNRDASISSDAKMIVLAHEFADKNFDLYVSKKKDKSWTRQVPIDEINSLYNEKGPELSNDGRFLFFSSDRPGGYGGYDIWYSFWNDGHWSHPVNMGDLVNTASNERCPSLSPDGLKLFFSSDRPYSNEDSVKKKGGLDFDIYEALAPAGVEKKVEHEIIPKPPKFQNPRNMENINSPYDEGKAVLTPRGNTIYFSSNRPGGIGGYDLYKSFYVENKFLPAKNFGTPINSPFDEINPTMSLEGFRIYFSSNRKSRNPNDFQVFKSTSREVLMKIDYNMLMKILFAFLGVVLAVLIVYYLLRMLLSDTRMSLIWKCLLLALLLHLLLGLLSAFWYFGTSLADKLVPAPKEMTININNLARESIAMAIRESVSSLPNIKVNSTAEKLPVPTQKPVSTQSTPVSQESTVPKTSVTPVAMKPVQISEAGEPPSGEVALPDVAPLMIGDAHVKMNSQPGEKAGESTAAAGKVSNGKPKPFKPQEKKQEDVVKYVELNAVPIDVEVNQVNDPVKEVTKKNNKTPSKVQKALSESNRVVDSPKASDETADEIMLAAAPAPVSNMQGALGTFFITPHIKLDSRRNLDREKSRQLDLLAKDPHISREIALILNNDKVARERLNKILTSYIKKNQLKFNSFELVEFLIKKAKLKPVGDMIYKTMEDFNLPVDEELDLPEKYQKR